MDNNALKDSGPSFIADLARMGGTAGSLTATQLKDSGPSFPADMARMTANGPDISATPILTGKKDTAYAGFTAKGKNGTLPLVYALVGTWPAGIAINSGTGVVSGTPTASGSFASLSIKVTDAATKVAQLPPFTIVVAA